MSGCISFASTSLMQPDRGWLHQMFASALDPGSLSFGCARTPEGYIRPSLMFIATQMPWITRVV